jgi:hypothetical protein
MKEILLAKHFSSLDTDFSQAGGNCLMTYGKEIEPQSTGRRVWQYLIGGIGILVLLGLFVVYWPAAIAVICGVILWQKKKSQATVTSSKSSLGMLAKNTPQKIFTDS